MLARIPYLNSPDTPKIVDELHLIRVGGRALVSSRGKWKYQEKRYDNDRFLRTATVLWMVMTENPVVNGYCRCVYESLNSPDA